MPDSLLLELGRVLLLRNSLHLSSFKSPCYLSALGRRKTRGSSRIEALLIAVGCTVIEGRGSRVRFAFGDKVATFHRPHPAKEAKPYQVEDARTFLERIGVKP
ncbi:type II toxin-antitoxin system HicA family toxin [Tepidimonas taiwanensis]|uniref:type II toxin-antitoxin system HicA family toxin n=1 Tax=Tepidimonas taiwanensis TaxID=307486 RepID=UPI002286BF28|nr:type II toxin-antitoxin system HicA family toxin [Tepidimonas taiwanensis]